MNEDMRGRPKAVYISLGVVEWRKTYVEHEKLGKKAILFGIVITMLLKIFPSPRPSCIVLFNHQSAETGR